MFKYSSCILIFKLNITINNKIITPPFSVTVTLGESIALKNLIAKGIWDLEVLNAVLFIKRKVL